MSSVMYMKCLPPIVHFKALGSSEKAIQSVQKESFIAGKHPVSDLVLISIHCNRTHAFFCWKQQGLFVMDKHSVNGVFINQNRIDRNEWYPLDSGDKIVLGNLQFDVTFEGHDHLK